MIPAAAAARVLAALRRFQDSLDQPYKMTPAGMWACSVAGDLVDLFGQVDLAGYGHFADLGSGDGRAVLLAATIIPATGIEADPELVDAARAMAAGLGLTQAGFICADLRQVDLGPYDLLFIYPDKPLKWLEDLLPDSWRGDLLVYGHQFRPEKLIHAATLRAGGTICTLWRKA
ncbi:MAG: hypothetical protein V1797_16535 [Pseudomonadota bacterium]